MPIDNSAVNFFEQIDLFIFIKGFLVIFVVFYMVFSFMLYKQVQIMSVKLPTSMSPILKFISILHIGVSVAVLFFVIGAF